MTPHEAQGFIEACVTRLRTETGVREIEARLDGAFFSSLVLIDALGTTWLPPTAPACPPASSGGPVTRLLLRIDAVIGARSRIWRIAPSSPRHHPRAARAGADREAVDPWPVGYSRVA